MKLKYEVELSWRIVLQPRVWLRWVAALGVLLLVIRGRGGLPEKAVGLYAILALLFAFEAQWSLILAIVLVAAAALMQLLKQPDLTSTYALYAFYLLTIGVVGSLFELDSVSASASTADAQEPPKVLLPRRPPIVPPHLPSAIQYRRPAVIDLRKKP